jgi:hypothetical protein
MEQRSTRARDFELDGLKAAMALVNRVRGRADRRRSRARAVDRRARRAGIDTVVTASPLATLAASP